MAKYTFVRQFCRVLVWVWFASAWSQHDSKCS